MATSTIQATSNIYIVPEIKRYTNVPADSWYTENFQSDDLIVMPFVVTGDLETEKVVVAVNPTIREVKSKTLLTQDYTVCFMHIKRYT